MSEKPLILNRRKALALGAVGAGSALAAGGCADSTSAAPAEPTPVGKTTPLSQMPVSEPGQSKDGVWINREGLVLNYDDNVWNRDAMARIHGTLDFGAEKIGWYKGKAIGVMPGKKNIEICGFEGFSVARLLPNEDGSYRKVLREVGFYTDLKTGEILETMVNPYTGETVNVVPIANDPFNFTISEFVPLPPTYGGLNKEAPPRIPLLLNWDERGDKVLLTSDIHLFYPSALQPEEWPRESPGKMTQVSEMFRYYIDPEELGDPDNKSVNFYGNWVRTTPWFPWMLMDQAPGHITYVCDMGAGDTWDIIPKRMVDAARAIDPKYLSAPTEDYGPSLSSLEHYKLEQTPAPVRSE